MGEQNPIRWRGHYYDAESGLYYADGRYYDPEVGQYLDAIEIPEAISEKYLDRNGILCDNILELMPYMYSVLVNMAKDPACTDTEEGIPWWNWLIAAGVIWLLALTTVVTSGLGLSVAGVMAGMLKGAVMSTVTNTIFGGFVGGISAAINGGDVPGGILSGASDAVLSGLISGALSGALGTFSAGISGGTRLLIHKGVQVAGNVVLSGTSYILSSAITGRETKPAGFFASILSGVVLGMTFNASWLKSFGIGMLSEMLAWFGSFLVSLLG